MEHMACPRIVIDKVRETHCYPSATLPLQTLSRQLSSSSQLLPREGGGQAGQLLSIPREDKHDTPLKQRKSGNCR